MEVIILNSIIQFKNPLVGQPTRAIEEHYNGRRVTALVDGEEKIFRFKKDKLAFNVDEDEMIEAVEQHVTSQQND